MRLSLLIGLSLLLVAEVGAQAPAAAQVAPNLVSNVVRPVRYHPVGEDFVITNGGEFFNRPLYGGNTAFRVDAGDRPEFALYLPGRGGNVRLGVRTASGAKWLHEAATILARYRPGEMLYTILDPLLGAAELRVTAVALPSREGFAVCVEYNGAPGSREPAPELLLAFGGASGERGRRDGDIGTESVPISEWFQLKPAACRDHVFTLGEASFTLKSPAAELAGVLPAGAQLALADAHAWDSPAKLLATSAGESPVLLARVPLVSGVSVVAGIEVRSLTKVTELDTYRGVSAAPAVSATAPRPVPATAADWPRLFAEAEAHFAALRGRVRVKTPDPWLNAAVGALNVAADAAWDEPQQAIMHGAVAWRTQLLGWRGPYALDALGWPERAHANFSAWLGRQNTSPVAASLPPADAASNLARSEAGLHSNGDLANSHYDMNLVFIDALFRHLLWTGDEALARQAWPVIERHLAWERRLFRREFDANGKKLPLYEAYAAIWASDDLQYSGGGTAHASAYNYWHNRMAARLAPLVGADPTPYTREADLIAEGMRQLLWVKETGMFAEAKDWLGLQQVHPAAALWSFYHTMDAGLVTTDEADSMASYVTLQLPWLPVAKVDESRHGYLIGTTTWMPYTWSLNNVVFSETMHGALGLWQADQVRPAELAMQGAIIASMYSGICPGNVGSMTYHDVYRRESQRDFADGSGTFSRALVEGLFGVRPDALKGELRVVPGISPYWNDAAIEHPRFSLSFHRKGVLDRYTIRSRFGRQMSLRFESPMRLGNPVVRVNGQRVEGRRVGREPWPRYEFVAPPAETWEIEIEQAREGIDHMPSIRDVTEEKSLPLPPELPESTPSALVPVALAEKFNDRVTEIFKPGKYVSPRSPFVSLALPAQGIGYWAGHVNASAEIDDTGLRAASAAHGGRILLPNGVPFVTPGPGTAPNILFTSQWDNYPPEASVPLGGKARRLHLLMAGSTNAMQSRLDNGEVVVRYTDGAQARLALRNPETWWPIEQDYFTDDFQFRVEDPLPTRVDLKTGTVRVLEAKNFKGKGGVVPGGAATVLTLDLDPAKELQSLTVRALANDVVIGLMAATLERD